MQEYRERVVGVSGRGLELGRDVGGRMRRRQGWSDEFGPRKDGGIMSKVCWSIGDTQRHGWKEEFSTSSSVLLT